MGKDKYRNEFKLTLHQDELDAPYKWKTPRRVFVNSMSDLFHEDVPLEFIQKVFTVMNDNPRHSFQVLTKRAERLAELSSELTWTDNIWMGVSVEDDLVLHRVDALKKCDARIKFLSVEPLIGPVPGLNTAGIDWVIAGGESGPRARPIQKQWVLDVMSACRKSGTAFFFKQWGKPVNNPDQEDPTISKDHPMHAKGGCMLEKAIYREMPG